MITYYSFHCKHTMAFCTGIKFNPLCNQCMGWYHGGSLPCFPCTSALLEPNTANVYTWVIESPLWYGNRNIGEAVLRHIKEGAPLFEGVSVCLRVDQRLGLILKMTNSFGAQMTLQIHPETSKWEASGASMCVRLRVRVYVCASLFAFVCAPLFAANMYF